ncbi:MAG: glutathione S-transferase family protein [Pseudomonadota bacterium]
MKFHYAPGTISIATGILLEETGLSYEKCPMSFANGDQTKPEYLAINPKARVPSLETDQGVLTETGAIAEFIAAQKPELGLVPQNAFEAAQMRAVCYYLASTFHVNHAHNPRGSRWANDDASLQDMKAKVPETMSASCTFIEEYCALTPFVMGKTFTVADPWLFAICTWLGGDGVDIADYPKLNTHFEMMMRRSSVKTIKAYGLLP